MVESFFKDLFYHLTKLLHKINLIKGDDAIIDSAPILVLMNFAKANIKPKINVEGVLIQEVREKNSANNDIEQLVKCVDKNIPCLFTYLENVEVLLDNNPAERAIRPFMIQ